MKSKIKPKIKTKQLRYKRKMYQPRRKRRRIERDQLKKSNFKVKLWLDRMPQRMKKLMRKERRKTRRIRSLRRRRRQQRSEMTY